jgi:DNA-binding GntR family transcriptional regulator
MSTDSPSPADHETQKSPQPSQREIAYNRLRRLLVIQKIPAGERLREPTWSARLDVNRTALREAFARLEAEGWLVKGERTGYFVPKLSKEDISEILIVRISLECCAIEQLCEKGLNTPKQLQPIKGACDQLDDMIKNSYLLGASEADRRFHDYLVGNTGNKRLKAVYYRAPLPLVHDEIADSQYWEEECRIALDEHRRIYQAILDNQPAEAIKIMRRHLSERYLLPLRA